MERKFDRAQEDLGNSVWLEHVNVEIEDQNKATLFYMVGLGLTRDPYMMPSLEIMWVNCGRSQFHLPNRGRGSQVLRGHTGLVIAGREALLRRLAAVKDRLAGTRFAFAEHEGYVEATCPFGNTIRCYEPDERFGRIRLGMPYVEFTVPGGAADGIARFYRELIDVPATVEQDAQGRFARALVGPKQHLIYRETDRPIAAYDGHHLQIYIVDFSGPHRKLKERGLVFEESDQWQYRFKDIIDLDSGKVLFTIEHEVRSFTHPLYNRHMVNRNPAQTNLKYAPGYDAAQPGMTYEEEFH